MKTVIVSTKNGLMNVAPDATLLLYGVTKDDEGNVGDTCVYDMAALVEPVHALVKQGANSIVII